MKMRKIIFFIFYITLSPVILTAQIKVTIPDTTAFPGDTVVIPVKIENISISDSIYAIDILIQYDTSKVCAVSHNKGGTLTSTHMTNFNPHWRNYYNYLCYGGASASIFPSGDGVLVYLSFILKENITGIIPLKFVKMLLNEGVPPSQNISGSVTILNDADISHEIVLFNEDTTASIYFSDGSSLEFNYTGGQVSDIRLTVKRHSVLPDSFIAVPKFDKSLYYYDLSSDDKSFSSELIFGYIDSVLINKKIEESSIAIAVFDSTDQRGYIWHSVPVEIDTINNTIRVSASHFSLWAVVEKDEALIANIASPDEVQQEGFGLFQNYPNPFNLQTTIRYKLSTSCRVKLEIFNSLGRLVTTIVDGEKAPGEYEVLWDGKDETGREVASGIYFYRLRMGTVYQVKRMTVLK